MKQKSSAKASAPDRITITNKINVPAHLVSKRRAEKYFAKHMYNESGCSRCPFAADRPVEDCSQCPNFLGTLKLYDTKVSTAGDKYVTFPPGDPYKVLRQLRLEDVSVKDLRKLHKFDFPIKFKWQLYDGSVVDGKKTVDQRQLIDDWVEAGRSGIIKSPPRSGKTPTSICAMIETGCKFIIIAHESRLLDQFYKTIMGDPNKKKPACTNIPLLEKKHGTTLCKIITNVERDFKNNPDIQIALITYQKFIKLSALSRIKLLNARFSGFIVDENHQAGAFSYLKFLSRLKMRYRLGLSATPLRKDGLDWGNTKMVGPVVAVAKVVAIVPRVEIVETSVTSGKYGYKSWVGAMKFLGKHEARNKMIVREVFADLRSGKSAIIIPVDYKEIGEALTARLNKQAKINNRKRGEDWPETFAAFYHSKVKNKGIIEDFDAGKVKVLVAIRSMIKQGIDMEAPDCLLMVVPMSADKNGKAGAPIFEQLSYRVATWTPKKKDAVLKVFIDGISFSTGCFRGLFFKEILPGLKAKNGGQPKYRMDEADFKRAFQIASDRGYGVPSTAGKRITSEQLVDTADLSRNSSGKPRLTYDLNANSLNSGKRRLINKEKYNRRRLTCS